MSKWNSPEWAALYSGEACPICREGRPLAFVAELNATYLTSSDRFHFMYPPNINEGTHLISRKGPTQYQVVPFVF